jgi:hypothetical protein
MPTVESQSDGSRVLTRGAAQPEGCESHPISSAPFRSVYRSRYRSLHLVCGLNEGGLGAVLAPGMKGARLPQARLGQATSSPGLPLAISAATASTSCSLLWRPEMGATVLHFDADFDRIASVTGQRYEWSSRQARAIKKRRAVEVISYSTGCRRRRSLRWQTPSCELGRSTGGPCQRRRGAVGSSDARSAREGVPDRGTPRAQQSAPTPSLAGADRWSRRSGAHSRPIARPGRRTTPSESSRASPRASRRAADNRRLQDPQLVSASCACCAFRNDGRPGPAMPRRR